MHTMLNAMHRLDIRLDDPELEVDFNFSETGKMHLLLRKIRFQHDAQVVRDAVLGQKESEAFSPRLAKALRRLWSDGGVQTAFEKRSQDQLSDSGK